MTYNVSSGTLNTTIPYYTILGQLSSVELSCVAVNIPFDACSRVCATQIHIYFTSEILTSFFLPFSELSLVGLALSVL